jgi:hypothetical protein
VESVSPKAYPHRARQPQGTGSSASASHLQAKEAASGKSRGNWIFFWVTCAVAPFACLIIRTFQLVFLAGIVFFSHKQISEQYFRPYRCTPRQMLQLIVHSYWQMKISFPFFEKKCFFANNQSRGSAQHERLHVQNPEDQHNMSVCMFRTLYSDD